MREIGLKDRFLYGIADRRNQIEVDRLRPGSYMACVIPDNCGIDGFSGLLFACNGHFIVFRLHVIGIIVRHAVYRNGRDVRIPVRHIYGKFPGMLTSRFSHNDRFRALHRLPIKVSCLQKQGRRTVVQLIVFIPPKDRALNSSYLRMKSVLNNKGVILAAIGFRLLILHTVSPNLVLDDIVVDHIPVFRQRNVFKSEGPDIGITVHRIRGANRDGTGRI